MTELYPPIEPYDQGLLDVGDGNLYGMVTTDDVTPSWSGATRCDIVVVAGTTRECL